MPSSGVRITSVEIPRIVRVTGTTMSSLSAPATSVLDRTRTGRRLSGSRRCTSEYHRGSSNVLPAIGIDGQEIRLIRKFIGPWGDGPIHGSVFRGRRAHQPDEASALMKAEALHQRKNVVCCQRLRHGQANATRRSTERRAARLRRVAPPTIGLEFGRDRSDKWVMKSTQSEFLEPEVALRIPKALSAPRAERNLDN
jgi:hypothetical protein